MKLKDLENKNREEQEEKREAEREIREGLQDGDDEGEGRSAPRKRVIAAPSVHRAAKRDRIDLSTVQGSGERGAITVKDYESHLAKMRSGKREEFVEEDEGDDEDETQISRPVQSGRRSRDDDERYPLHNLRDDATKTEREVVVDGVRFTRLRTGLDHSVRKNIDIPSRCLNNELHYRVVNDVRGKLQGAQNIGYRKVDKLIDPQTGEEIQTAFRVGTNEDGSPKMAYLMATPKKWKQERDQAAEQDRKTREDGLFVKGRDNDGDLPDDQFYVKKNTGIKERSE